MNEKKNGGDNSKDEKQKAQNSNTHTPNNDNGKEPKKRYTESSAIGALYGFFIILAPLYFFLVWKKLPDGTAIRWLITLGVLAIIHIVWVFANAKKLLPCEKLRNFIIAIFIALGAALLAIYFGYNERTVLFKIFVIAYFSFLPPWLYLQFFAIKGKTLWDEYVLNLHRLHADNPSNLPEPPVNSLFYKDWKTGRQGDQNAVSEIGESIYKKKFKGLYGSIPSEESLTFSSFRGENFWPVVLATLIISIGWVLVVRPETIIDMSFLPNGFTPAKTPVIPLQTISFGFIGAYFYVLQMLVRRYFQNDLKTSAYMNAIMRIIVVILLVWVLDMVFEKTVKRAEMRAAFAFIIGVFPYVGWQALQALVKLPIKVVLPGLRPQYPLSELDGLNIWYESRLLEEGIEDMQNLATANMVDLMLNTRIPVDRLVDWVDQSILYLHLGKDENDKNRKKIRKFGIRTATDLEDAFARENDDEYTRKLEYVLNENNEGPSILRIIEATLKNEPNLFHVKEWRKFHDEKLKRTV